MEIQNLDVRCSSRIADAVPDDQVGVKPVHPPRRIRVTDQLDQFRHGGCRQLVELLVDCGQLRRHPAGDAGEFRGDEREILRNSHTEVSKFMQDRQRHPFSAGDKGGRLLLEQLEQPVVGAFRLEIGVHDRLQLRQAV